MSTERFGKQLELFREAAPGITRIAVWWDIQMSIFHRSWAGPLETAASKLGLQIQPPVQVLARDGVEGAFATMKRQRADAVLIVLGGPTFQYIPMLQQWLYATSFRRSRRSGHLPCPGGF